MNSETVSPMPPRRFSKRRKETSVTPAIGERISGGLISISRILNGLMIKIALILDFEPVQELGKFFLILCKKVLTGKRYHLDCSLFAAVVIPIVRERNLLHRSFKNQTEHFLPIYDPCFFIHD